MLITINTSIISRSYHLCACVVAIFTILANFTIPVSLIFRIPYHDLLNTGNLEKWYRWTSLQGGNRDTDVQNGLVDTGQGAGGVGRTGSAALACTHCHVWTASRKLLCRPGAVLGARRWPRGLGCGCGGQLTREGVCIYIVDSLCCTAETNITLQSNYTLTIK